MQQITVHPGCRSTVGLGDMSHSFLQALKVILLLSPHSLKTHRRPHESNSSDVKFPTHVFRDISHLDVVCVQRMAATHPGGEHHTRR